VHIGQHLRPIESLSEGFAYQSSCANVGRTHAGVDLIEELLAFFYGYAF
jgi:hypothetical protein